MKERIAQLEAQLQQQRPTTPFSSNATAPAYPIALAAGAPEASTGAQPAVPPEKAAPFAYADWTWLNGTSRNKDAVWDSKS